MTENSTWTEDATTDSAAAETLQLGRTTVLPHLQHDAAQVPSVVTRTGPRYDNLKELGRGGLGVVLEAHDRDIGRRVAIKQLRDDRRSHKAVLRFAEEVRTVGKLDHPNIVPIHDVGQDEGGNPYFVMKHVDGETLEEVLQQLRTGDAKAHAKWTFTRRLEAFRKVLEAVGFAHDRGIVHRDIKPENIMIGTHGEVHVLDWGIAQRKSAPSLEGIAGDEPLSDRVTQTRDGAIMGTPAYMSPEQAQGIPVDPRTDIYSLGVVLHEFLGLQHYLAGINDVDGLLEGVQKKSLPGLTMLSVKGQETVPAHLNWFVGGATAKNPDGRYESVAAWLERMDSLADGDIPVQCPFTLQQHWATKFSRSVGRHPFVWSFLFFTLTAGGTIAALSALTSAFVLGAVLI